VTRVADVQLASVHATRRSTHDPGRALIAVAEIRPGQSDDLEQLNDLYNHYVRESPATFDIVPLTMEQRQEWFDHLGDTGPYRLFVAADDDSLVGYASSHRFRPKQAYETSVEASIYLAPDAVGQGIGTALYTALFDALAGEDLHRAYAGITVPNDASIALHERFDFRRVAYFSEQGRKLGRYWDVAWYEKPLPGPARR
jgi:phosphinothricin acetyltransferase